METPSLQGPSWRVIGEAFDHAAFFRKLALLLPDGAVLVLEGGRHPKELDVFLQHHEVAATAKVTVGTAWPRQRIYHVPIRADLLTELADLTERCAAPEVCEHLHVHHEGQVLLQWFDAFSDPLSIAKSVPKERLDQFCSALGLSYVEQE